MALGASLSLATMGRRTAAWKAVAWGALAGTLPDLDVLIDHQDAVLNMVLHRAESHSLFYLALLSGPLAWLISRVQREPALWPRWWLAMALALVTHPLLDTMTVYGTQLLLPFSDEAFGVGSVFIIDPAYTLPLLAGVCLAWAGHAWGHRANLAALTLSTLYLAWGVQAQALVAQHAHQSLHQANLPSQQLLVTPTPFNSLLWRVVAMDGPLYHEGFYSLLDRGHGMNFQPFPSGEALAAQHRDHPQVQRVARFSDGFFRVKEQDGHLWLTDLRMGQEPAYAFHFDIGPPLTTEQPHPPPATQVNLRTDVRTGLAWLWTRLWHTDAPPLSPTTPPHGTQRSQQLHTK